MRRSVYAVAAVALASLALAAPARAQNASMQVGNATVTIGGGIAALTLPDVPTMLTRTTNTVPFPVLESYKFSDDFENKYGWNVNGSVAVPVTGAGADEIAASGFWARIKDNESFACNGGLGPQIDCLVAPLVDNPAIQQVNGSLALNSVSGQSERKVDQWGGSLEAKWFLASGPFAATRAMKPQYLALGADVRGIYQNIDATMNSTTGATFAYNESLDTTYYGAFLAWGGDYAPILLGGIWNALGLQSSFRLQGGVYYADTQYSGNLVSTGPIIGGGGNPTSSLSLSNGNAAFIGGVTLETRKQITPRTNLSLKSEYEYYSWVPKMAYNNTDRGPANIAGPDRQDGTVIGHDDAFSMRTTLTLTIGLGPDELYQSAPK
jgi:hypothetical protein